MFNVTKRTDRHKGATYNLSRTSRIGATGQPLVELNPLPATGYTRDHTTITILEYGRRMDITALVEELSNFELRAEVKDQLATQ